MPPDRKYRTPWIHLLFFLIAITTPVLAAAVVYVQWSTPALDCAVDPETGIVGAVPQDSYANVAGLQPGDVILTVEGTRYRDWNFAEVTNRNVIVRRGEQELSLEMPVLPYAQLHWPDLLSAIFVALTFSGLGTYLYWRRAGQFVVRLFFLMVQSVSVGLLVLLAYSDPAARPYGMAVLSSAGFHLAASLLVHYHMTFPVVLGSPRQRRRVLSLVYGLMPLALACRLSGTEPGLKLAFGYNTIEIAGAIALLVYGYRRRATPDGRRRMRLVVFGGLAAGIPGFLFYLIPTIAGSPYRMPDWMVGLLLTLSPLSYILAIVRHNLFDVDRVLNRALVYATLSLGILLLYLGPFLLIYRLLPGDWLAQAFIVAGLTLVVGMVFDWTRRRVQQGVDRLFYGGWYDYPVVVDTISEALARSIERDQLTEVLTHQVPALMQLLAGRLHFEAEPAGAPAEPPPVRFTLAFQGQPRGVWIVGARRDGEVFGAGDLRILKTLARQAEVAFGNVLLVEMLRRQLEEIGASREMLAQAQRQLLSSREEERARLARDLHDGPIQELVGLNMQLGLLLPAAAPPLADALTTMRAQVRALLADLRQVCAELRPPMLDVFGLGAALRALGQEWSAQTAIPIRLDLPPDPPLRTLPEQVAVNLYRLAQEALSNIARHAAAHSATLRVEWDGSRLVLLIGDDGCGFTVPAKVHGLATQGHFGLLGMEERVHLIDAEWTIESVPGHGTTVRVLWPRCLP